MAATQSERPHDKSFSCPIGFSLASLVERPGLAPVIMMYMSAIDLVRGSFIFGISVYFIAMGRAVCVAQSRWPHDLEARLVSALTLIPLALGMSLGQRIGEHVSHSQFETIIQLILLVLGLN